MQPRPRLPLGTQVGYATAESGINMVETMLRLYLLVFYTDRVGLAAHLAGLACALAIVWDAVTDPVMGVISDRTRHRFGGRRGYLPAGGLLLGLGVLAVFFPPALDGEFAKFTWLLGSYCFLNTGMTVLSVPYMAMAGELTQDPGERVGLFGARFVFANVGAVLAAAAPPCCGWLLAEGSSTTAAAAAVAAALVVATALVSWRATANVRFVAAPAGLGGDTSWFAAFVAPFGNAAFRPLLLAYVLAYLGIGVNAASFLYYYEHVLGMAEGDRQTVLGVFLLVFTASILLWVKLGRRFGKRRPLLVGATVLALGNTLLYALAPQFGFWFVLLGGGLGLALFVGAVVLIDTMLTDVLDHDLLRVRRLRSGLFFGVWRFASKLARALSVGLVGAVLGFAGFRSGGGEQPEAVRTTLMWLFGPGVGACFLASVAVLWRWRFREPEQARVRALLARRSRRAERLAD